MDGRLAVVVFNLGGPDRLDAVEPFLVNLFSDPAILAAPGPIHRLLAKRIAKRRAPMAREIYSRIGGRSPLREITERQAEALQRRLRTLGRHARVFVCMRYWHPRSDEAARAVKAFDPDEVVLLPLYPQFSTTTTGSSLEDWRRTAAAVGLTAPTRAVCCYPVNRGFVRAVAERVQDGIDEAASSGPPRVLFSAHGLPKRVIARGDPYQWQVEASVAAVVQALGIVSLDHAVCYQSRVGPLAWIGLATEDELARAARDRVAAVVVPIAFVSEHSETLVELDIEYRERAEELGIPAYVRVPTVGTAGAFIEGLVGLVEDALSRRDAACPEGGRRACPNGFGRCPCGA